MSQMAPDVPKNLQFFGGHQEPSRTCPMTPVMFLMYSIDTTNFCLTACPSGEIANLAIGPSGHWPLAHLANRPIWPMGPAFGVAPVPYTQDALEQHQKPYAKARSLQIVDWEVHYLLKLCGGVLQPAN